MIRTRVGYSGGTTLNPTYRNIGDHMETVELDFDPGRVSYRQLLDAFWESHDPSARSWSRQYKVVIFYRSEEQRKLAEASKEQEARERKQAIRTEILPFTGFSIAEDYHQKYRLQQDDFFSGEFEDIYPSVKDLVNSTAAARVNAILAGYGTREDLGREISTYGLSEKAEKKLRELSSSVRPAFRSCPL